MNRIKRFLATIVGGAWLLDEAKQANQKESEKEQEFSFVWYKRMVNNGKTHYTEPFRTKIKAKTRELAIEKCQNFAMNKMTLVIWNEADFDKSEISVMQKEFDKLANQMEVMFGKKE